MILIASLGELAGEIEGYVDQTDKVVEYHVQFVGARTTEQLASEFARFKPIDLKKAKAVQPYTYEHYVKVVRMIEAVTKGQWLLRDLRPLWFLTVLEKLVSEVKIIAYDSTAIRKALGDRKNILYLTEFDQGLIENFIAGQPPLPVGKKGKDVGK
jgi:hypothetical protein